MTTFLHTLTGRTFVAQGVGAYGAASAAGQWDSGERGTIFPTDTLADGRPVWVATA